MNLLKEKEELRPSLRESGNLGIISVALLITLFFALHYLRGPEKGIVVTDKMYFACFPEGTPKSQYVIVKNGGELVYEDQVIGMEQLKGIITSRLWNSEDSMCLWVLPERRVEYGTVIQVYDELEQMSSDRFQVYFARFTIDY